MQIVLFLLCTIPFWTSNVIRMISWIPLLGRNGLVNDALLAGGLVDERQDWLLFSEFAVVLAFVHLYTLFMIVPIFNSMMRIDRSLLEAARDAGASGWQTLTNVVASLIVPSVVVSLGIGLGFRLLDEQVVAFAQAQQWTTFSDNYTTWSGLYTSALGAHLTWTLPFGLLIMFAVFNRFDKSYEEAARDLGASDWQTFRHVVLPIIAPSLIGVALFGFTLSYDELARSSQAAGDLNTLPLELQGLTTTVTTPEIYALGTLTTSVSFAVIGLSLAVVMFLRRRRAAHGTDAGKGMV